MRGLSRLQDEFEVAYARIVVVSVDPPEVQSAFRAGLGARFTFLSDAERLWLPRLGLLETTDTVHHPYLPAAFTLSPDLRIHRTYNGYWYFGRPTHEELRRDMREINRVLKKNKLPAHDEPEALPKLRNRAVSHPGMYRRNASIASIA